MPPLRRYNQAGAVFSESLSSVSWLEDNGYTVNGGPVQIYTPWGIGMSFDGTNDYIDTGMTDGGLNFGSGDFSILLKCRYTSTSLQTLLMKGSVGGGGIRYQITVNSGDIFVSIDDNTVAKSATSTSQKNDGTWHTVSGVRDGNNLRLYLDGSEDPSATDITGYGSLDNTEPLAIGSRSDGNEKFNGEIKDVILFDRALSAAEIEAIYKGEAF